MEMSKKRYKEIHQEIEAYYNQILLNIFNLIGMFFCQKEKAIDFANQFFDEIDLGTLRVEVKLNPNILIVKPGTLIFAVSPLEDRNLVSILGVIGIVRTDINAIGELVHSKRPNK